MPSYNPKISADPVLHRVLDDVAVVQGDVERSRADILLAKDKLFTTLEDVEPARKLIGYLTGPAGGSIGLEDAAPIGSMLDAIGTCENLDLMLNSAGGSGEVAEKIIEMCRAHCTREFRVIVPNYAKSAATMISLGADVIIMGYLSELGPIDPQYVISTGSVERDVSGQSFLAAFNAAQEKVSEAMARGESPVGYLHSLSQSSMDPAFIEHCRRGIEFSRDVAEQFLPKYQLKARAKTRGERLTPTQLKKQAQLAAENLLSANSRFVHGRLIGATEARDEVGLHVVELDREDEAWKAYWELYVRAEVYMQHLTREAEVSKLFFDRGSTLPVWVG